MHLVILVSVPCEKVAHCSCCFVGTCKAAVLAPRTEPYKSEFFFFAYRSVDSGEADGEIILIFIPTKSRADCIAAREAWRAGGLAGWLVPRRSAVPEAPPHQGLVQTLSVVGSRPE